MYNAFFRLTRDPFSLTPDPHFLVSTRGHNEVLAALYYGVRWHKGFVVVTGEVGTGKTMLLRCLFRLLNSGDIAYSHLFNSRLSPAEFLQYIASDFGLPASDKNKCELLLDLGRFLVSRGSRNLTTVLIVDEAHHLSDELLEEVRLLSNIESCESKLLQIVLVGQLELDEKLDSPGLRQLKQRIAVRAHLTPLNSEETQRYIERRLEIARDGACSDPIFLPEAIAAVYYYSHGLPRLINTICENALIAAYSSRLATIPPEIVETVAREFRLAAVGSGNPGQTGSRGGSGAPRPADLALDSFEDGAQEAGDSAMT